MWMTPGMMIGAGGAITAALSDNGVQVSSPGSNANAGVTFGSDGELSAFGGSFDFPADGEWHPEGPDASLGPMFEVRCASISSGSWTFAAEATGTWIDLSVGRTWRVFVSAMAAPTSAACTAIFQIRQLGGDGTILAEAQFSCHASN